MVSFFCMAILEILNTCCRTYCNPARATIIPSALLPPHGSGILRAKNSKITILRDGGRETVLRTFTRVAGLLIVALAPHPTSGAGPLRVGAAAEVIPPPVGTPM